MVSAYQRRRDLALAILRRRGLPAYTPQGAFYLMVDISGCGLDSDRFARDLLSTAQVAVAPGRTFGPTGDRYVRVSLAADEKALETGLERLCNHILQVPGTS
jgi:aspartate/methionine/tyrosine aminotransferase